ncbi:unannotated protein [freshwater metagenome]|uniref:Unannotated protein n=1 Tax=freshwater metagenome TaxID=449393 RepID=A0A6J7GCF5_9ZZZZ
MVTGGSGWTTGLGGAGAGAGFAAGAGCGAGGENQPSKNPWVLARPARTAGVAGAAGVADAAPVVGTRSPLYRRTTASAKSE